MATQNEIYLGFDNPVIFTWSFSGDFAASGLNTFTDIQINIGGEDYSTLATSENLFIVSNTELRLKIGDTTSLTAGSYLPEITGFSPDYNDGYLLNGVKNKRLTDKIKIK